MGQVISVLAGLEREKAGLQRELDGARRDFEASELKLREERAVCEGSRVAGGG